MTTINRQLAVNPAGDTARNVALAINELIKAKVPQDGTPGQTLTKGTGDAYDWEWATPSTPGSGTVTSVSVITANGISGSVANPTTNAAITLTLGAITPTTIVASGAISGSNLSGTNTGDQANYTDEQAQDAVGAMVDGTLTYVDAAPLLQRAALTGDVTAAAGSNATVIGAAKVQYSMIQNVTDARILGRSSGSAGPPIELTVSTGLSLSGGVLTATGSGTGSPTGNTLNAEILADSPTAYWRCNDTSGSTIVESIGAFNLTVIGTPTLAHSYLVPTDATSKYLRIKGTGDGADATTGLGLSYPLTGDISFECIVNLESNLTTSARVFDLGLNTSETQANNVQFNFFFSTASSGFNPNVFWESGSGVDTVVAMAPVILQVVQYVRHYAVTVDRTAKTATFYINGRQVGAAVSFTTNPDGGTGSIKVSIGNDGNTTNNFVVGEMAIYSGQKISAARWWAHARAAGLAAS